MDYGICTVKRGKIRDSNGRELDVESTETVSAIRDRVTIVRLFTLMIML